MFQVDLHQLIVRCREGIDELFPEPFGPCGELRGRCLPGGGGAAETHGTLEGRAHCAVQHVQQEGTRLGATSVDGREEHHRPHAQMFFQTVHCKLEVGSVIRCVHAVQKNNHGLARLLHSSEDVVGRSACKANPAHRADDHCAVGDAERLVYLDQAVHVPRGINEVEPRAEFVVQGRLLRVEVVVTREVPPALGRLHLQKPPLICEVGAGGRGRVGLCKFQESGTDLRLPRTIPAHHRHDTAGGRGSRDYLLSGCCCDAALPPAPAAARKTRGSTCGDRQRRGRAPTRDGGAAQQTARRPESCGLRAWGRLQEQRWNCDLGSGHSSWRRPAPDHKSEGSHLEGCRGLCSPSQAQQRELAPTGTDSGG
mmetsp:Transcript_63126/g.197665  ORF Transcript_63126/g.197665 Transcript_63126/m.197665 type:complete len:367 (-) Transcript_63126:7-1107(-)